MPLLRIWCASLILGRMFGTTISGRLTRHLTNLPMLVSLPRVLTLCALAAYSGFAAEVFSRPIGTWLADVSVHSKDTCLTVRWRTVNEVGLIGFDVYHAVAGAPWHRLNEDIIPAAQTEYGQTYMLTVPGIPGDGICNCKIVAWDNDLNPHEEIRCGIKVGSGEFHAELPVIPRLTRAHCELPTSIVTAKGNITNQSEFGQSSRVCLITREAGLHCASSRVLAQLTGQPISLIQDSIRNGHYALLNRGKQVGYVPAPTGEDLVFCAERLRNNYTEENIYWLVAGTNLAMPIVSGGGPAPSGAGFYLASVDFEMDRMVRYELATDPDEDYWFWERLVAAHPLLGKVTLPFAVDGLARVGQPVQIRVRLKGGTSADHLVYLGVNGCTQQEWRVTWRGKEWAELSANVQESCLVDGTNWLTLKAEGTSTSHVYVDGFGVHYAKRLEAVNNAAEFSTGSPDVATVRGFSSPDILVFDVSEPAVPRMVVNTTVDIEDGKYNVSFVPASGQHRYAAFAGTGGLSAPVVQLRPVTNLLSPTNRADMVMIGPEEFLTAALPLADHRRQQGFEVKAIPVESIYDEFNHGVREPEAIRHFLRYARANWEKAPRYLLLVGNGTYDYRNIFGHGDNKMPPLMIPTLSGLFASDTAFGDIEGNAAPEVAVGRLPARSAADVATMVKKIIAYESGGIVSAPVALLVADAPDQAGDFVKNIQTVATELPDDYLNRIAYPGPESDVRNEVLNDLRQGIDLLCYIGHGAIDRLGGSGYLTTSDVPALANDARLPVVIAMTCLVGQFSVPGYDCLGERLLTEPSGGAVAVVSPTGLSYNEEAVSLNFELVRSFHDGHRWRLGDYLLEAMVRYNATGTRLTPSGIYGIIGDPAMRYAGALVSPPAIEMRSGDRGTMLISISGVIGQYHSIWVSSDITLPLSGWINLTNWVLSGPTSTIEDSSAGVLPLRFYRVGTR